MPGVADAIRKTQLKQEQKARKNDMSELLKMVQEGRLHEADERQLETLKLALELNNVIGTKSDTPVVDADAIAGAVSKAMSEVIENMSSRVIAETNVLSSADPARPGMKHTNLVDLQQVDEEVEIVDHGDALVGESKTGPGDAADKLAKLKKLRDGQG